MEVSRRPATPTEIKKRGKSQATTNTDPQEDKDSVAEWVADPDNALARQIVSMAVSLGIDAAKEFYLLPIAKHAVQPPEDAKYKPIGAIQLGLGPIISPAEADTAWFKKLVQDERERFDKNAVDVSPWLKLTEKGADGEATSYYYNFQTSQRATALPGYRPRAHVKSIAVADSELEVMKFTSWWFDQGAKKYIHVHYYMKTEEFEVNIDEDDMIYRLKTLKGPRLGTPPLTCWDLYLKGSVVVFGKNIALLQCDLETREWLKREARRLLKMRLTLMETLAKYEIVEEPPLKEDRKPLEEMHLGAIIKSINRLKNKLTNHRPKLANKFIV